MQPGVCRELCLTAVWELRWLVVFTGSPEARAAGFLPGLHCSRRVELHLAKARLLVALVIPQQR